MERSIRQRVLQEPSEFLVGAPRGSVRQPAMGPAKRYRKQFTAEDDQILYDWMERYKMAGGAVSGNKIYQQLEQQVPKAIFIYERQLLNLPFSIRTIHGKHGVTDT